jgi:vacuole morphology and inheritance protein 14
LVQIDNLIQLIESPVFTHLRLHLLEPQKYPFLLKTLYGILMILPQTSSYNKLSNRLSCVTSLSNLNFKKNLNDNNFDSLLLHFNNINFENNIEKNLND